MSARRSSRSRSKPRSKRDGEGSGSESESAPEPSPAELEEELDAVVLNPRREPAWLQPVLVLLSTRHLIGAVARAWSMLA